MQAANVTITGGDAPLLVASLRHSIFSRTVIAALIICVCTRILSSYQFKSVKNSKGHVTQPPTLPYWIPFLRHAFSMAWDTKRFTAKCLNKHGDGTPFFIDAAGRRTLVLLDPTQIKKALNASNELDPNPFIHDMILGQMLGSPQETIDFYKADKGQMDHIQMAHIRQHVTGPSLISMSRKVYERLTLNIGEFYSIADNSSSEGIEIPDLFEFVQYQVTRAITETLMGSNITQEYPELFADQWRFMDSSIEIVMGLPRFVIPAAYAARDRLLANLKTWNNNSEILRKQHLADSQWDARAGSGLLQERQERYAKTPGFNEDARVSQILGLLFAGNSVAPTVCFWNLFEVLKDPQTYDFGQLTVRPLLQSLHAETTRYYASNVTVRVVTSPTFALDDKYTIPKDTLLFIYNKFTGQFTPGWTSVRPHSTSRPLAQFWADRFLFPSTSLSSDDSKRSRFSDANLTGSWTSFGGGEHKCPGRHLARNIGIATLAVLMGEYEVEFMDPEKARGVTPAIKEEAFGKMVPTSKIAARLRRRQKTTSPTV